jgi:hypothetical protein
MDIPCEWDGDEADIQEWDDDYDNKTQTEYHINMIPLRMSITIKNVCL